MLINKLAEHFEAALLAVLLDQRVTKLAAAISESLFSMVAQQLLKAQVTRLIDFRTEAWHPIGSRSRN